MEAAATSVVRGRGTALPIRPATLTRSTGTVLFRYVNDRMDGVGFSVDVSISGTVDDGHRPTHRGSSSATTGQLAVAGLDLAIEPGEIFGLVGPNGAGKTTTLRMLATLLRPSAGDRRDRWLVRDPEPR